VLAVAPQGARQQQGLGRLLAIPAGIRRTTRRTATSTPVGRGHRDLLEPTAKNLAIAETQAPVGALLAVELADDMRLHVESTSALKDASGVGMDRPGRSAHTPDHHVHHKGISSGWNQIGIFVISSDEEPALVSSESPESALPPFEPLS
jgi:hypothetical protein